MPFPRFSLLSFLTSAKTALSTAIQKSSPVTFVIGNEAADLDSICSAVVLAYLHTYSHPKSSTLYIPISNIPRADLALRPELLPVLSHANLKPSDLITLSDLPSPTEYTSYLPPDKTRWLLVDHNALLGEIGKVYGGRVVGCIDHHDEENKVPKDTGDEPRVVRKSGSCASLVVEYCRGAWDSLATKDNGENSAVWNSELAHLALGPVLIDTSNLENEAKTTSTDIEAVKYLEQWIKYRDGDAFDAEKYYKEIWTAERDVDGLSALDLLRKDYKLWIEKGSMQIGVCSVVKSMSHLIEKAGGEQEFLKVVEDFARERDLSICSVMTRFQSGGSFRRELLVWGLDEGGIKSAKRFEATSGDELSLKLWQNGSLDLDENDQWRRCWWQGRVENSRKQVAPLLRASANL